jgi:type IV secretion system protein VirB11
MRPDRLFMQEVRGPEAFGFIRALATGHAGATSWHAEEGREFDALALMVKQHEAGRAIPDEALKTFLRSYIDITVWCSRDDDGFHTPRIWFRGAEQ